MMAGNGKILPDIDPDTREYWAATREHKLLIQHCQACGHYQFYPRPYCTRCLGGVDFVPAAGQGTIYSFTVVHRPVTPAYEAEVPYVVALVDLAEGVRVMANVTGCPAADVHIGMPVQVTFAELTEEVTLPQFVPRH